MLEYCKTILSKVSFDRKLFEKELVKAISNLAIVELKQFQRWCYERFAHLYLSTLNKHFRLEKT